MPRCRALRGRGRPAAASGLMRSATTMTPAARPSTATKTGVRAIRCRTVRIGGEGSDVDAASVHQPPIADDDHSRPSTVATRPEPGERLEVGRRPEAPSSSWRAAPTMAAASGCSRAALDGGGEVQELCLARRRRRARAAVTTGRPRSACRSCRRRRVSTRPARLERLATADQDPGFGGPAGPDHDRGRRGEAHGTRAGDDQDADRRDEREREAAAPGRAPARRRRSPRPGAGRAGTKTAADPVGERAGWAPWSPAPARPVARSGRARVSRPTRVARKTKLPVGVHASRR